MLALHRLRLSRAIPVWGKRTVSSKPAIRWPIPQARLLAMPSGRPRYTLDRAGLLSHAPIRFPLKVFRRPNLLPLDLL